MCMCDAKQFKSDLRQLTADIKVQERAKQLLKERDERIASGATIANMAKGIGPQEIEQEWLCWNLASLEMRIRRLEEK